MPNATLIAELSSLTILLVDDCVVLIVLSCLKVVVIFLFAFNEHFDVAWVLLHLLDECVNLSNLALDARLGHLFLLHCAVKATATCKTDFGEARGVVHLVAAHFAEASTWRDSQSGSLADIFLQSHHRLAVLIGRIGLQSWTAPVFHSELRYQTVCWVYRHEIRLLGLDVKLIYEIFRYLCTLYRCCQVLFFVIIELLLRSLQAVWQQSCIMINHLRFLLVIESLIDVDRDGWTSLLKVIRLCSTTEVLPCVVQRLESGEAPTILTNLNR